MNRTDPDYAAFLDRLPKLRQIYDRRLHQWMLTTGRGDSLSSVERYFRETVQTVTQINRQTLKRLAAFVDYVEAGMQHEYALRRAWEDFPDPRGRPNLGAE